MKAGHIEPNTGISHRAALIAVCPDHEGEDDWTASIFDVNGDQSEDLSENDEGSAIFGTFRECAQITSDFAARNPDKALRVVIERAC